jgi:hypothetical protein
MCNSSCDFVYQGQEIEMFDIILEGDALQIVNAINLESQILNRFGHFIEGIRSKLYSLRSFYVLHVQREANSTAHCLARIAINHVIDTI